MRPVTLIILDGWGMAPPGPGNAISQAKLPFYKQLLHDYPHGRLNASGEAVGLPRGEDGNTETGHINLGAGYIVYQDLPRINLSIADGSFFKNPAFLSAVNHARKYQSKIHLIGLVGSGGVHSNIEHLLALLELMKEQGFTRVFLHLITDGRDSPPRSAAIYIKQIQAYLDSLGFGQIASMMGRYYAMDRDMRWDRTQKAYKVLTRDGGNKNSSPLDVIASSYKKGITDEFIIPTTIIKKGKPVGIVEQNDSVIFLNFRIDRPRQLTKAFVLDDFKKESSLSDFDPYAVKYLKKHYPTVPSYQLPFDRGPKIPHLYFVTMTEYSQVVKVSSVAFPPNIVSHPVGEVISLTGLSQLHISESEKERFVTYYFNGLRETPFIGEARVIIPSPKVATYDLKPEMSSFELTDVLIKNIRRNKYNFILLNFANPDMVAHTGNLQATIKACESVDLCLSKIIPEVGKTQGTLFITGDHGNAEEMLDPHTGEIDTEHSTYPVPFIAVSNRFKGKPVELHDGVLADVAPTVLDLLHLKKPQEMSSRNLLLNIV